MRWISVPLAALAGWAVALITGIFLHDLIVSFCPDEQMVSGLCVAWWFKATERAVFLLSAGLAATLVIVFPVLTCPSRHCQVARVTYLIGLVVAGYLSWLANAWPEFAAAALAGLATVVIVEQIERE